MKQHNIVYKITNCQDNKIYIGVHETDNLADGYMGSGKAITSAISKFGAHQFKREILFDYNNPYDMYKKEWELVNTNFIKRSDTYNIVLGGECNINPYVDAGIFVYNQDNIKIKISLDSYEWQYGLYEACNTRRLRLKHNKIKGDRIPFDPVTVVNNNIINKTIKLSELQSYKELGWIRGNNKSLRSKKEYRKSTKGMRKMKSPAGISEYVYAEDIPDKLKNGWIMKYAPKAGGNRKRAKNQSIHSVRYQEIKKHTTTCSNETSKSPC